MLVAATTRRRRLPLPDEGNREVRLRTVAGALVALAFAVVMALAFAGY